MLRSITGRSQSIFNDSRCIVFVNRVPRYDMDFGGSFYTSNTFMREMVLLALESPESEDDSS